eukprot:gene7587-19_t
MMSAIVQGQGDPCEPVRCTIGFVCRIDDEGYPRCGPISCDAPQACPPTYGCSPLASGGPGIECLPLVLPAASPQSAMVWDAAPPNRSELDQSTPSWPNAPVIGLFPYALCLVASAVIAFAMCCLLCTVALVLSICKGRIKRLWSSGGRGRWYAVRAISRKSSNSQMQSAFASFSGVAGVFTSHGPGLARAVFDDVKAMKEPSSIHFNEQCKSTFMLASNFYPVALGILATFISGAMGFNPVALAIATTVAALQYVKNFQSWYFDI